MILYAVTNNLLKDVPVSRIAEFEAALLTEMRETHSEITDSIAETGKLLPDNEKQLKSAIEDFVLRFV